MGEQSGHHVEVLTYSYYRDAELRGSNLLYRMLRLTDDPDALANLTQHLSEETRHAWLWTQRIRELGAGPVRIEDGYQVRIGRRAGVPRDFVDLLALTVVVEQRALRRYREHMRRPGTPARTLEVLRAVTRDEGWHVDWMRQTGRKVSADRGDPDRFDRALKRYRAIDEEVIAEMNEMEGRLA